MNSEVVGKRIDGTWLGPPSDSRKRKLKSFYLRRFVNTHCLNDFRNTLTFLNIESFRVMNFIIVTDNSFREISGGVIP